MLSNASGGEPARASLHAAVKQVASRDPIIAGLVARVGYIKYPPVYNALTLSLKQRHKVKTAGATEDFGEVLREWIGDLGRAPESYSEAAAIPL